MKNLTSFVYISNYYPHLPLIMILLVTLSSLINDHLGYNNLTPIPHSLCLHFDCLTWLYIMEELSLWFLMETDWLLGRVHMRIWSSKKPTNQDSLACISFSVNWWALRNSSTRALQWPMNYLFPTISMSLTAFWVRNTDNTSRATCLLSCCLLSIKSSQLLSHFGNPLSTTIGLQLL